MTEKIKAEDFIKAFGSGVKETEHHYQLRDCENCVHHSDNGCEVWECEFKRRSS